MYTEQKYSSTDHRSELECSASPVSVGRKKKGWGGFKRAAAFVVSAVIFGGLAGASFYEITTLLAHSGTAAIESQESEPNRTTSLSAVSYTSETAVQSLDVSEVAAQGLSSVVSVTNISVQQVQSFFDQFGRNGRGQTQLQETTSCGSGVIVYANDSYLYMLTNYHVIEGATTLSVTFVDDQTYQAQLCGYEESMDIALLKVPVAELSSDTLAQISVVVMGHSEELVVGQQVVAIGNALGYGQSVTTGIVSALDRAVSTDAGGATYIQTDAAINPGNSGGALFNMSGELVGINTAKVSSTDVEGMGYAIPISQVLEQMESLMNEADWG